MDSTQEIGNEELSHAKLDFTCKQQALQTAKFHVITVSTPIHQDCTPNLQPLKGVSFMFGKCLVQGTVVIYESTFYPGVTEEICIPMLESVSGMKCGKDFHVGYSLECINPGDKVHRLYNIMKIVSATNQVMLFLMEKVYRLIIKAGVYCASSIKVAEVAKVIENSQRCEHSIHE